MTGPTRAPATLAADLAALSKQATEGPWEALKMSNRRANALRVRDHHVALYLSPTRQDAAYIAALVNAHRARRLRTADEWLDWVAEQLADPEVVERASLSMSLLSSPPRAHQDAAAAFRAALAALRDRAASPAQPDTTHDTKEP